MTKEAFNTYSLLLDRTARKVKHFAQQRFKEGDFGITVDQWMVLKPLYLQGPMSQKDLAELTHKDHPTMTRIIDLLCKKELCQRCVHPEDRRSFRIELTKEGEEKVSALLPEIQDIRIKAWENLTPEDFQHFKRVLDTIYQNLS